MITSGDTITNPVTGEQLTFHKTSTRHGRRVRPRRGGRGGGRLRRRGAPPPEAERDLRGAVRPPRHEGRPHEARALTRRVVHGRARHGHKFWNASDTELVRFTCEVRPALQFEALLETMFALAADGRTNRKGMPNPLRLAVIANHHFDDVRLPFPPAAVQKTGLVLGAPLGRLVRLHPLLRPGRRPAPGSRHRVGRSRHACVRSILSARGRGGIGRRAGFRSRWP